MSTVGGALAVLLAALVLGGGRPQPAVEGLPDPGAFTGWALPVSTVLFYLAAVGTVGSLLTGVLVSCRGRTLPRPGARAARAASWWALAWATTTAAVLLLQAAEFLGVPPTHLLSGGMLLETLTSPLPQTRALLVVLAVTAVVTAYSRWVDTRVGCMVLLVVAVAGILPTALTGHAASSANQALATSGLLVHVAGATLWVGGVVGMVVYLRRTPTALALAVPRFSRVALVCFAAVALSGLVTAMTRLGVSLEAWLSAYGLLVLAKGGALLVLGTFGWLHRQRSLPAVVARRPRAFLALAAGEVVVMAATLGLAVALSRTPSPAPVAAGHPAEGAAHVAPAADVAPFSIVRLFTEWRLDVLAVTAVFLGLVVYLVGVLRLVRRGGRWPHKRTGSAVAAAAVAVFALCGGLATYSATLSGAGVAQLLTLSLVAPALLVLSAPVTLALRGRAGPSERAAGRRVSTVVARPARALARYVTNPVWGLAALLLVGVAVFATPVFDLALRNFVVHMAVVVAAFAAGTTFLWSLFAVDRAELGLGGSHGRLVRYRAAPSPGARRSTTS